MPANPATRSASLFDLGGTLIDSVYEHVLAWQEALRGRQIELSTRHIHRREHHARMKPA